MPLQLEKGWLPMPLRMGPPLPRSMGICWPWYKGLPEEIPPEGTPPPPPPETPQAPPIYYQLYIYTVGSGLVTPANGNYLKGSVVTLTAKPEAGNAFNHWAGDTSGQNTMVNVVMDRSKSVTAYFSKVSAPEEGPAVPPPYEEAPPPEETPSVSPAVTVSVSLKNPPSQANKWQIVLMDWDVTKRLSWGAAAHDNIRDATAFETSGWKLPLRIELAIYESWQEGGQWHSRQLYRVQSWRPLDPFEGTPDPSYKEIFIPDYGSYYFNCATERFEKA